MTCAKKRIDCEIWNRAGRLIGYGENACGNPQLGCPRLPGEGYSKCKDICQQEGHAEIMAIKNALEGGQSLKGATAVIHGAYRICQDCAKAMRDAGIKSYTVEIA